MSALEVSNVSFSYGAREVLHALNFNCQKGRLTALLGPNGAGKTTLISLLTCLYPIQQGQIQSITILIRTSSIRELWSFSKALWTSI